MGEAMLGTSVAGRRSQEGRIISGRLPADAQRNGTGFKATKWTKDCEFRILYLGQPRQGGAKDIAKIILEINSFLKSGIYRARRLRHRRLSRQRGPSKRVCMNPPINVSENRAAAVPHALELSESGAHDGLLRDFAFASEE